MNLTEKRRGRLRETGLQNREEDGSERLEGSEEGCHKPRLAGGL